MAAISHVFTLALVARMLSESEDRLWELTDQMEPEDGVLWVHDIDERETMAFTHFGIETLKELIADQPRPES
ncbi:hypothetical protein [Sphingosinicella soli]|uniref:Uncharacterized protein n=1 Tax=Sphingosinicella soli TaxID=333708 RepID=A0A7W7AYN2_9SPHN|nr:hypothetical protein [Sphingosinicella soli]MBB4630777.1 hypothetical protein [Sphingosinicella soli]